MAPPRPARTLCLTLLAALVFSLVAPLTAAEAAPTPPATATTYVLAGGLEPGSSAIVRADGDCLRLRADPSLDSKIITCMPEGSLVTVIGASVQGAEYRWLLVQYHGQDGWVADEFLEPAPVPQCGGEVNALAGGGLRGDLPPSGVSAVVWGGGTTNGILTEAIAQGAHVRSIWAQQPGSGRLVGWLAGVPEFVNDSWREHYVDGRIPAGSVLLVVTGEPTEATAASSLLPDSGPAPIRSVNAAAPSISAKAAVVVDAASGAVLFEKDAHKPLAPASLTKMLTAVLAIEGGDLQQWVVNDVDSRRMPGSSLMGLLPGDCFQLRDLLYGLMLRSGNDAALAIGRYVAGSDEAFARLMNTMVARLGLQDTHFSNPHGLDDDEHLTSAYDLATIARYGMTLPAFREVVGQTAWVARGSRTMWMSNFINSFLEGYDGADGLKSGFTGRAGRTLAVSATRNGQRVIAVLLDAPDRFEDAEKLLDWTFRSHSWPESGESVVTRAP